MSLDGLICLVCLLGFLEIGAFSLSNPDIANLASSVGSLFGFLYSLVSLIRNSIADNRAKSDFMAAAENILNDCESVATSIADLSDQAKAETRERVGNYFINDWKKAETVLTFQYEIIDFYSTYFISQISGSYSDRLLLKYRIITSSYNEYFSRFSSELQNADFFTDGTEANKFIKKLYLLAKGMKSGTRDTEIENKDLKQFAAIALRHSITGINQVLAQEQKRERVQFLLNKAYENAYASVGKPISNKDGRATLILLFKYDERFSIYKRKWHTAIRQELEKKYVRKKDLDEAFSSESQKLDAWLKPQPFTRALQEFSYCIFPVGKDKFLYVIDPARFDLKSQKMSPDLFMQRKVVPRVKIHLEAFNAKLLHEFPYLKELTKKQTNANYYILPVKREDIGLYAEASSIPIPFQQFLLNDLLESDMAGEHVASQLIYIKQVIDNLTLSGLLFTESNNLQDKLKKLEKEILSDAKKQSLRINGTHEIASLGNQDIKLIAIIYLHLFGKKHSSTKSKNYKSAKQIVNSMISNAKELLSIFRELEA